jgi:hypothetical protein
MAQKSFSESASLARGWLLPNLTAAHCSGLDRCWGWLNLWLELEVVK